METRDSKVITEAEDLRLDWALDERVAGHAPPDLTAEVLRRHRAGAGRVLEQQLGEPTQQRALVAAVVLLGLCSLVAYVLWAGSGTSPGPDAGVGTQDAPGVVTSRAEIEALPAGVRHVVGHDLDDEALPALGRLTRLERLELRARWAHPVGLRDRAEVRSIGDAGIGAIVKLPRLVALTLDGQVDVGEAGLAALARIPRLEELELRQMVAGDAGLAVLKELPRLRTLALCWVQGFGDRTLELISHCDTLRSLSLLGCQHLDEKSLARLGSLVRLERLDLGMIGSRTWFSGLRYGPLPEVDPGSGVSDVAVAGLAPLVGLRELDLSQAGIGDAALRHLSGMKVLASLDLSGTGLSSGALARLPSALRRLTLRGSTVLGADLGAVLARALPELETLDLLGSQVLEDGWIAGLAALRSLRDLDLSYCPKLTRKALDGLLQCRQVTGLTVRGWTFLQAEDWARVRALPELRRLDHDGGTEQIRGARSR